MLKLTGKKSIKKSVSENNTTFGAITNAVTLTLKKPDKKIQKALRNM